MTAIQQQLLSRAEARSLTDEVKNDAERLWRKLVELYEGGAHEVLGYKSWGAYFKAEFGGEKSQAYRVLDAGRVAAALDSPIGERPVNEAHARELAPLKNKPAELRGAWAEVVELHPEPTAKQVREVVARHVDKPKAKRETPRVVTLLQELYVATQDVPLDEAAQWDGDWRRLAKQWALVQSYFNQLHEATGAPVPEVVKGAVV